MKKEYVKPEMVVEQFMAELAFLGGSGLGGNTDPDGPGEEPLSNDRRGGWGDLWN